MSEKNTVDEQRWEEIIDDFIKHVQVLKSTAPLVLEMLSVNTLKASRIIGSFVEQNGIKKQETEDGVDSENLIIPMESFNRFVKLDDQFNDSILALRILPVMFVVSLVSQFDAYLGKLIRQIFNEKPDILNSSSKSFSFSELCGFGDIEEAKEFIIEKEVEAILRDSHLNHFVWLETKLGIPFRKDLPSFENFIEITERRNLFVHCNGIVSSQYLSVCNKNCPKLISKIKLGDKLHADPDYLLLCQETVQEIGIKLGHVLWRKLNPEKIEQSDAHLINVVYDLLLAGEFKLAQNLAHFSTEIIKKHGSEDLICTKTINHALSYYLDGNTEKCKSILKKKDWSASNDKFLLAVYVLNEEFDKARELMISMGSKNESLTQEAYREWPLFNKFRQSKEFQSAYKEIFEEDFVFVEHEPTKLESILDEINLLKESFKINKNKSK